MESKGVRGTILNVRMDEAGATGTVRVTEVTVDREGAATSRTADWVVLPPRVGPGALRHARAG